MSKKYSAEYFYNKFAAIPEERWNTNGLYGPTAGNYCVLGHLGAEMSVECPGEGAELSAFRKLFADHLKANPYWVNDAVDDFSDLGDHPKERILNALTLIATGILKETA